MPLGHMVSSRGFSLKIRHTCVYPFVLWVLVIGKIKVSIGHKMSTYKVLLRGIEIATCTQIANTQLHPVKNCCAKEMMKLGPGEVEQIPAATQLVSGRAKTTELF